MPDKQIVLTWLNDAYAMENALEKVLKQHAKDAEDEPKVHDRILQHLDETRAQAETVKECINVLGGKVSRGKEAFATMFGAGQGMVNKAAKDTMVKNAIADYAAEHFEIACYRALIDATERIGADEVAEKLRGILRQEQAMADFLATQLPEAVAERVAA